MSVLGPGRRRLAWILGGAAVAGIAALVAWTQHARDARPTDPRTRDRTGLITYPVNLEVVIERGTSDDDGSPTVQIRIDNHHYSLPGEGATATELDDRQAAIQMHITREVTKIRWPYANVSASIRKKGDVNDANVAFVLGALRAAGIDDVNFQGASPPPKPERPK